MRLHADFILINCYSASDNPHYERRDPPVLRTDQKSIHANVTPGFRVFSKAADALRGCGTAGRRVQYKFHTHLQFNHLKIPNHINSSNHGDP